MNICGLFRSATTVPDLVQRWRDWLGGPADSVLRSRVGTGQFVEDSFCSVAGICVRPQRALGRNECSVGDALTMIPPVTGNGMSMAFESAELAVETLVKFSRGDVTWLQARREIARRCDQSFAARLRWAALFQPCVRSALLFLAARSEWNLAGDLCTDAVTLARCSSGDSLRRELTPAAGSALLERRLKTLRAGYTP